MFYKLFITPVLLLILFSAGCGVTDNNDQPSEEVIDNSSFSMANFPRVDGSTSTLPMLKAAACEIFNVKYSWMIDLDGTRYIWPAQDSTKKEQVEFIRIINFKGTHQAYVNLISDSTDIIIVAREPSEDELTLAKNNNISMKLEPVALDALVFVVNAVNTVNNLTSEQILNIYTGFMVNWNQAAGSDAKISPYSRNRNSGSQELMEKLVMQGRQMLNLPDMVTSSMMGLLDNIEKDPNGLGYTVYFYNSTMVPRPLVKTLSVNGISPSSKTIADRTYPYTAPVYAVIRTDTDTKSTAYLLWRWLCTNAGQTAVAHSGYVSYTNLISLEHVL